MNLNLNYVSRSGTSSSEDETPDLARFMRKVETSDLARSNMFLVRFVNLNNGLNEDSVVSPLSPLNIDNNGFNRIKDISYNQIQKHLSPRVKSIMGASTPLLLNTLSGAGGLLSGFFGESFDVNRDLAMFVKSVSLPGTAFDTQVNHYERNPFTEVRNRTTDPIRMSFYCSPDYAERTWFLTWMNSVHDQENAIFGFYSDYAKPIDIITLDRAGVKSSTVNCVGCFPIRVGEVQLGYDQNNEISFFEVEFAISTMNHVATKGSPNMVNSIESFYNKSRANIKSII